MAIGAGNLSSLLAFAERTAVPDGYGNEQDGWTDRFTRPAQVNPARGSEALDATRSEGRGMIAIMLRADLETTMITSDWKARDMISGVEYNVRSAIDPYQGGPQHNKWIMITAEFGRATG